MSQLHSQVATEQIAPDRRLVVIQRNPTSGSGRGRHDLTALIRSLKSHHLQVRLFASRERLDEYVRDPGIATRIRCLVAAGGDGTIGSLVNRHASFPVATLPLGTENLVARFLKIGRHGDRLADLIERGCIRRF
ncbi:MAG: acylglycerol kinase family protein, partial [Planctomycetaceae bacterium]|nr:acylglycerol kinase family protein [Planctomycetaceae bacterium]